MYAAAYCHYRRADTKRVARTKPTKRVALTKPL
jgi:hypothetical protein